MYENLFFSAINLSNTLFSSADHIEIFPSFLETLSDKQVFISILEIKVAALKLADFFNKYITTVFNSTKKFESNLISASLNFLKTQIAKL